MATLRSVFSKKSSTATFSLRSKRSTATLTLNNKSSTLTLQQDSVYPLTARDLGSSILTPDLPFPIPALKMPRARPSRGPLKIGTSASIPFMPGFLEPGNDPIPPVPVTPRRPSKASIGPPCLKSSTSPSVFLREAPRRAPCTPHDDHGLSEMDKIFGESGGKPENTIDFGAHAEGSSPQGTPILSPDSNTSTSASHLLTPRTPLADISHVLMHTETHITSDGLTDRTPSKLEKLVERRSQEPKENIPPTTRLSLKALSSKRPSLAPKSSIAPGLANRLSVLLSKHINQPTSAPPAPEPTYPDFSASPSASAPFDTSFASDQSVQHLDIGLGTSVHAISDELAFDHATFGHGSQPSVSSTVVSHAVSGESGRSEWELEGYLTALEAGDGA